LKRIILAAATLSLLAGCAVGPDYRRPELGTEVPAGWSAHDSTAVRTSLALQAGSGRDGRWWTGFHDATLDSLVERALAHNPDLQAAAARVLEARALAGGARADRWPSIEVGGTASRSKSANLNFPGFVSPHLTSFSASATARYEADLWGRVARGDEAAVASLLASDHERAALARSIVAAVINARFETLELSGRTQLTEATLTSYRQTLEAVEDRYRQGLVPSLDFELARQNLLAAQAGLPPLQQQLAAARRRLEILCGSYPHGLAPRDRPDRDMVTATTLPSVPEGLPSDLLERRPDLQASELRLHASVAQVGQAKAALYPRISLTGSSGFSSRELSELGKSGTDVWSLVGNIVMPLINRGATKAQYKAAEARAAQAAAGYRQTVLEAFAEVENALDLDYYLALQQRDLGEATQAAVQAERLAADRYRRGLDNILVMLESQRRSYATQNQLLTVERQRNAARVNLIVALGGPWDPSLDATESDLPEPQTNQGVSP